MAANVINLSAPEVQALLREHCWRDPDPAGSAFDRMPTPITGYKVHGDSTLLLFSDGSGALVKGKATWLALGPRAGEGKEQQATQGPISGHILEGLQPYAEKFPSAVPELVETLADRLALRKSALDESLESLELIDKSVREKVSIENRLTNPVFIGLVAYVGQVIKKVTQGEWEMRHVDDADVWEPWVRTPKGRSHPPFLLVWDEFCEPRSDEGSILGATMGETGARLTRQDKQQGETA